ncbi:protein DMR6-LIKE OXYGENASE 1-like isoform X2 [Hibiscus syriacus]|uniref:protein DMR6-LIKE OXYGENASE 1-like isoform X2 n=1 Tax=Hibiscus syriacus TaxID=106335 RepID=UPI001921D361|nr:protein DMR6-LIKE OXYGENASE 1-like isoform X2 [Hibiscus syriacus]
MGEVDQTFIQAADHRPKLETIEFDGIPLIDLSTGDIKVLVSEIADACKNWGFFQVINHGVPLELFTKINIAAKTFFDRPIEEKRKVKRDEVNSYGYHESEHTKNVRDWKEVFDFLIKDPSFLPASPDPEDKEIRTLRNQWPENLPEFREVCQEYARELEKLAYQLLELMALSLGLPSNRFDSYFEDHTAMIRFNHYPPCPCPELALGVGRHKDAGALTIVAQDDVGGLQVKRKSDGVWVPVKPTPNALVINVWSNEAYESVEHRVVVNSERERFSIPVFFFPSHYVMVKPLEELVNEQNPAKYKEYNFGKFFVARSRGDYKKLEVEDIQIHDFKII